MLCSGVIASYRRIRRDVVSAERRGCPATVATLRTWDCTDQLRAYSNPTNRSRSEHMMKVCSTQNNNLNTNNNNSNGISVMPWPRVGSGVVRIDPLRFLAGCRKRRLNQASSVLSVLA